MNKVLSQLLTRLKHLRGKHDQRDHAWNRGMGRGDTGGSGKRGGGAGVELGPNQMGPLPTMQMYRQQRQQLQQQLRDGAITRTEMQTQLQNLRGVIAEPSRRDNANFVLASKRNPKLNPSSQNDFFNVVDEAAPRKVPTPAPALAPTPVPASNIDRVIKEFLDKFDESGTLLQQRLDEIAKYPPIKWSSEDKTNYEEFILDEYINNNMTITPDYDKYIDSAESNGLHFHDVMDIHLETPNRLPNPVTKKNLMFSELQLVHLERAKEVSKMAPDAQDALYEILIARIKEHKRAIKENPDLAKHNPELANDAEAVMALALYGHPDLRLKAVQYANDKKNGMPSVSRTSSSNYLDNSKRSTSVIQSIMDDNDNLKNISEVINYYSLEYRLALALSSKLRNRLSITHIPSGVISAQKLFIKNFTFTHTSETTTNVLGAAIQTALSRVGPNVDAPSAPSFYPLGVKPPEPHPTIIEFLQKQYEDTQKELAKMNVSAMQLYRGTRNGQVANGIPMSPWSENELVAEGFSSNGGYVNAANMLAKYIFMYNKQVNFITEWKRESEYLILETAALEKSLYAEIDDYYANSNISENVSRADWTIKQLNRQRKNGISVFDESNGVVDYSFSSAYEPQYDIFYNYRKKPKAKSTAKQLTYRIAKLRNR